MKKIWITLFLLTTMLLAITQEAFANEEPIVTITLDKKSVEVGETVTAIYKIEGPRTYSNIRWDATMWISEYEGQGTRDGDGSLTELEGSFSYAPRFGEEISMAISFEDETGRYYWYEGERISITGYTFVEPVVEIQYDKKTVAIGEGVTATYKIEGPRTYSNIRWDATMWISEYEGQGTRDSDGSLTELEGSFSYAPRFGEEISMAISFEDETGRYYWYEGERISITGYTFVEPVVEIQYDKKTVAIGEGVTATYKIEGSRTYSDIRWDATMWISEYEGQGTRDSDGSLTELEGSFSYVPRFGEEISMAISFEDETGRYYWYEGKRIPIFGYTDAYDIYSVIEGQSTQISTGKASLAFRANGEFEKYLGIQVDGKTVPSKYVKAWSGSTYVELSAEYLATLPEGKHELAIVFTDGVAVTQFATAKMLPEIPQTGDQSSLVCWFMLMVFSVVGVYLLRRRAYN